jgi:ERF superfamily
MTRSESITHLASALAKAQAEMPVAFFDATNPFLKSKYASLGAVIQASRPILAKHKLSLVQFPISGGPNLGLANATGQGSGDCIGVESILTHESGEFVAERILIPLIEEKGKTKVQCAGSTLTYLRRYSWASILGMYSDEDSDGSSPVQAFTPKPVPALPPPPIHKHSNN